MLDFFELMTYKNWNGSIWLAFFFVSVLYLHFKEKNKVKRIIFIYFPIVILLGIYNPLTYWVYVKFFNTAAMAPYYCRLFMLMPITFSICYACVQAIDSLRGNKKYIITIIVMAILVCSGTNIFQNPWYQKADNLSKIPDEVLQICKILEDEKADIKVMAPDGVVNYLRQVNAGFEMPYGRVTLEDSPAAELVSKEPDMDVIIEYAKEQECNYFICVNTKEMKKALESIDFIKIIETDNWIVVRIN